MTIVTPMPGLPLASKPANLSHPVKMRFTPSFPALRRGGAPGRPDSAPFSASRSCSSLWQFLYASGAALPTPLTVVTSTWELIADPFFDRGGVDKGLFWHLYSSLKRVAVGLRWRRSAASPWAR